MDPGKFAYDRAEALRILKFHLAIVEEAKHGSLDEALVERSLEFGKQIARQVASWGDPGPGEVLEFYERLLHLVMRLHRELSEADGSAV